jgi:mRNA-degrading endonuclease toxin of MazEF toxin-antitoxin module
MTRFYFGQIVNASFHDGHRSTKVRPVVIIDRDADYRIAAELLIVPISSTPTWPRPDCHIKVHDSTKRDPLTGLSRPSWAKCDWHARIQIARIRSSCGHMPDDLLDQIVDAFDRLAENEDLDGWS